MSSRKCSDCGLVSFGESDTCRRCGAQFSSSRAAPSIASEGPHYQTPRETANIPGHAAANLAGSAGQAGGGGIWRDGKNLVFHERAELPDRCLTCNAQAAGIRLKKSLRWNHPARLVAALLTGWYVISDVEQARVSIGFCHSHFWRRRIWWAAAASSCVASVMLLFLGRVDDSIIRTVVMAGATILFIASIVFSFLAKEYIQLKKIREGYVWLGGVDKEYLAQFPKLK
jgi:hypothetical protein